MEQLLPFLQHVFLFQKNSPLLFTQFYFWAFFAVVFAVFSLIHSKRLLRNAFCSSSAFSSTTRPVVCLY